MRREHEKAGALRAPLETRLRGGGGQWHIHTSHTPTLDPGAGDILHRLHAFLLTPPQPPTAPSLHMHLHVVLHASTCLGGG